MALIQPDFSEAVESLPADEYSVRIVDSQVKISKAENQYVNWTLETFGKDDDRLNGRKIFYITMTSGKGSRNLKDLIRACGQEVSGSLETETLHGSELVVLLQNRPDSAFPEVAKVSARTQQGA
jgi:hypothetical protein